VSKVGLFYGTQTGVTEDLANKIADKLGDVDITDISGADASDFEEYDCIIIGCPTWNIGEMQADWEGFFDELDSIDFSGKKVAYFGPGDQIGYAENFQDAIGILEEKISSLGGQTVGCWPAEGYEDGIESKALRDGKFVGLAIDEDNQSDLTEERLSTWTAQLKTEFGL